MVLATRTEIGVECKHAGAADALEAEVRRAIPDQRAAVVVWRLTEGSISADKLAIAQAGVGEVILPKAFAAVSALTEIAEKALLEILSKPCRTALAEVCSLCIHSHSLLIRASSLLFNPDYFGEVKPPRYQTKRDCSSGPF